MMGLWRRVGRKADILSMDGVSGMHEISDEFPLMDSILPSLQLGPWYYSLMDLVLMQVRMFFLYPKRFWVFFWRVLMQHLYRNEIFKSIILFPVGYVILKCYRSLVRAYEADQEIWSIWECRFLSWIAAVSSSFFLLKDIPSIHPWNLMPYYFHNFCCRLNL